MSLQAGGQFDFDEMLRRQAMAQMQGQIRPQLNMMGANMPTPNVNTGGLGGFMRNMGTKFENGLGRVSQALFPMAEAQGMDPSQIRALRSNAMIQAGLGMSAAAGRGAGFGEAAFMGLGRAQQNLQGAMQQGYENARANRQEQRQTERDQRMDEQFDKNYERQVAHEDRMDERDQRNFERQLAQDDAAQRRWEAEQKSQREWRQAQIDGVTRNPEVRVTDRGMFERDPKTNQWNLVPGTEPTGVSGRPIPQGMANDMKTNASVMNQIDTLLPQLRTEDGKQYTQTASDAFGSRNAMIDMMTPDAISDNVKNFVDSKGTDMRATVTNLNSYIVKERNGAAVTVAEFARQRGFLPTDKDSVETVEKKLTNLRKAISDEQQYMLDFAESQGYRAPPGMMGGQNRGASGGWSVEEVK